MNPVLLCRTIDKFVLLLSIGILKNGHVVGVCFTTVKSLH